MSDNPTPEPIPASVVPPYMIVKTGPCWKVSGPKLPPGQCAWGARSRAAWIADALNSAVALPSPDAVPADELARLRKEVEELRERAKLAGEEADAARVLLDTIGRDHAIRTIGGADKLTRYVTARWLRDAARKEGAA